MALPSLRAPGASGGSELVRSVAFESLWDGWEGCLAYPCCFDWVEEEEEGYFDCIADRHLWLAGIHAYKFSQRHLE